jgi:dTDP-4-dehydrorhamnose 3,5-epimerase
MSDAAFRELRSPLPGLVLLERAAFADSRGAFRRLFCAAELAPFGWGASVAQINHSVTAHAGTTRGIHFQHSPHAEEKLVTCIAGRVWDVAVDLRAGSPTFLRWHAEELSAESGRALLLPKGFGHGFMALTDDAALIYVHSAPYAPQAEGGLHPLDPAISIAWPGEVRDLSAKDAGRPFVDGNFRGLAE